MPEMCARFTKVIGKTIAPTRRSWRGWSALIRSCSPRSFIAASRCHKLHQRTPAAMGPRPCGSLGYLAAPEKRTDGIAERIYFFWYGYVATPAGSERPFELLSVVILVPLG